MDAVLSVFAAIFMLRDAHVIALASAPGSRMIRFGIYSGLVLAFIGAISIATATNPNLPARLREPRFAAMAILIQLAETLVAWFLHRSSRSAEDGGLRWVTLVLPAPALVTALCGAGFALRSVRIVTGAMAGNLLAGTAWLALVGFAALVISQRPFSDPDRDFVEDFAVAAGCTGLAFAAAFV